MSADSEGAAAMVGRGAAAVSTRVYQRFGGAIRSLEDWMELGMDWVAERTVRYGKEWYETGGVEDGGSGAEGYIKWWRGRGWVVRRGAGTEEVLGGSGEN